MATTNYRIFYRAKNLQNPHDRAPLTIPIALGRRSGAVYGEILPKTRLARIYFYGHTLQIVWFQKKSKPTPWKVIENSKGEGGGVLTAKFLEEMCENKLEFPEGRGASKQKTFRGGSMDIFWNCTL